MDILFESEELLFNKLCILTHLYKLNQLHSSCTTSRIQFESFMNLDLNTITTLNIFNCNFNSSSCSSSNNNRMNKDCIKIKSSFSSKLQSSVFEILNNSISTKFGSRKLKTILAQPYRNIHEINYRLNCMELFLSSSTFTNELRVLLSRIPDLQSINLKLEKFINVKKSIDCKSGGSNTNYFSSNSSKLESIISLTDCMNINTTIKLVIELANYFEFYDNEILEMANMFKKRIY